MNFSEFKNGLNNGDEFSVYLFEGEEIYFHELGLSLLKQKFLSEPDLNFVSFEQGTSADEIASSLFGMPFLSKKRITLAKELYLDAKTINGELKEYLNNPSVDSILIILNTKSTDAIKKFSCVKVIDAKKSDIYTIVKWIKAEFGLDNIEIEAETAKIFAEYCHLDMVRIDNEIKKLKAFILGENKIKLEHIEELVSKDFEYKIYNMTDYIGKRQFGEALKILLEMMDKGDAPQKLLISLYNYFRKLLLVAISDMSVDDLAKTFSTQDFVINKMKTQAKMFSPKALKNGVDALCEWDYKIKNGADAFESLMLNFFKIVSGE